MTPEAGWVPDTALIITGGAVVLAVPVTFLVARWVAKNVDHGEARFDTRNRDAADEDMTK
ncbi:glutamyl-tRNA amidotransferase [Alteraurantiacibacter palmitatis]|uniref:Glutamyl-tRNA amidotransferase n=1 Tax=Alteraurantiacibacter palmitatis TaxID=2054628 RepID=A0ABV7EAU2_9SPHN